MSSIRMNFPLIGFVKVKAHNADPSKFFLKSYLAEALPLLRESIPEISEASEVGSQRFGASVDREAFCKGAPVAYAALGQKAFVKQAEALEASKAKLPGEAAAAGDFAASLSVKLAEIATLKAAQASKPTFGVIDGGYSESDSDEDPDGYSDDADGESDDLDDNY